MQVKNIYLIKAIEFSSVYFQIQYLTIIKFILEKIASKSVKKFSLSRILNKKLIVIRVSISPRHIYDKKCKHDNDIMHNNAYP